MWGTPESDGADYIMFPSLDRALAQFKVGLSRPSHTQVEQRFCLSGRTPDSNRNTRNTRDSIDKAELFDVPSDRTFSERSEREVLTWPRA